MVFIAEVWDFGLRLPCGLWGLIEVEPHNLFFVKEQMISQQTSEPMNIETSTNGTERFGHKLGDFVKIRTLGKELLHGLFAGVVDGLFPWSLREKLARYASLRNLANYLILVFSRLQELVLLVEFTWRNSRKPTGFMLSRCCQRWKWFVFAKYSTF